MARNGDFLPKTESIKKGDKIRLTVTHNVQKTYETCTVGDAKAVISYTENGKSNTIKINSITQQESKPRP